MRIRASTIFLLLFTFLACGQPATDAVLTNAVQVLSLPGDEALGRKVHLRGVVTAAQPSSKLQPNWDGGFFVQDGTAGIFAVDLSHRSPKPGDVVEVTGVSHPGGFAPYINDAHWSKLGEAPLPEAAVIPIEQIMAGVEDSQRVEISGVVRSYLEDPPVIVCEIVSGGYRLKVYAPPLSGLDPKTLIGAKVRVRGTASTFYSADLRQLISVELHVPFASDFIIEHRQDEDPFLTPVVPLNHLGQYRRDRELGERLHVRGVVTFQRPGQDIFLQDSSTGIQVKSTDETKVAAGDVVEAVGFLEFQNFLPVLADASFRKADAAPQKVKAMFTPISALRAGFRHAQLIKLEGKVLDYAERQTGQTDTGKTEQRSILTLQDAGTVFTVEGFSAGPNEALARIPIGSVVEVNGVCFMNIADDGKLRSLSILLPSADGIRILKKPDWLTPHRLLIGVAILAVVLLVAVTWSVMVLKRNRALKVSIGEKVKAQQELQKVNDELEWRVAERTKQLKIQMTARKEAEVQFKATLAERTRLAQELHDTLEQSLTGIGLQVDLATKLAPKDQPGSQRHLGLARNLMTQTQLELRRSIWDLRSRQREEFDFPSALRISAERITEPSKLKLDIATIGRPRLLSEVTEENLLRISQAALNNVIKHANATEVNIRLQFEEDDLTLRIADNGCGFDPAHRPGSGDGHFGLVGISERAKRLDGELRLDTAPGRGTSLEIRVPLRPPNTRDTGGNGASPVSNDEGS